MSTLPGRAPLALLEARNRQAEACLAWHAKKHAIQDGASGGASGLIPFAAPFVAAGQLAVQARTLYPALARDLTAIYGCSEADFRATFRDAKTDEKRMRAIKKLIDMHGDDLAQLAATLVVALGGEFVLEIAGDLMKEAAPATLASMVPFFGAAAAAALDATLAATMTWRVGSMISLHLQHGSFVGNRKNTWTLIKNRVVKLEPEWARPRTLTRLRTDVPTVGKKLAADARQHAVVMMAAGLSPHETLERLERDPGWQVPKDLLPKLDDLVLA